jgi:Uma2 family endonuclease
MILQPAQACTWSDYQAGPEGEYWEIIDGTAYPMSPAPSIAHQSVIGRMGSRLERALAGKPCRPFIAPTDVKFTDTDIVQPDILVVCDPRKITPGYIDGAPDLVIEVLSPATATRDLREKKALYARHGVREYIIVDPLEHYAMRFLLEGAAYDAGTAFGGNESLIFGVLEGIEIPLWEVFELPPPGSEPAINHPVWPGLSQK